MKKNDSPIFTMLPASVLARAKTLAEEFRAEAQLKDLVWRNVIGVTTVIILLLFANGANGYVFGTTAGAMLKGSAPSVVPYSWTYAVIAGLGGMAFSFNAFVTWLELLAFRRNNPLASAKPSHLRFYRRATWIPLIPLIAVPAAFNAFFDVSFFLVTVGFAFVVMLVATLSADV
ncbi:MAG: hypothetical protein Q7K57_07365 [Burkholderiaceae bacterium]|nr:hypothetical protein [Burkholderiaceae bacterium]